MPTALIRVFVSCDDRAKEEDLQRLCRYECLSIIRSTYQYPLLPVIMVSAKKQNSDVVQGMNRGANDWVCKPFPATQLQAEYRQAAIFRSVHCLARV